jgi:3-hydroxy-9,10-secoandrosta-1,3,5(10)-triene-9,17-dione monooxygenase
MISPPEPDLSPAEIITRAEAVRPLLVEEQAATEQRSYYSEEIHEKFLEAGFYRMLVPRRFGGYEFDLPTFCRVIIEIARGCPSSGWLVCLSAGHALQVGAWFGEQAQAELFGDGDFRCAAVAAPVGVARRTDDGWELNGTHAYCSGAPYSTHYMGQTFMPGKDEDGPPGPPLLFVAPRSTWTMLDDWGDSLGLKGSGSQSIRFDNARIPAHFALEDTWMVDVDVSRGTPGYRLHGNPMYASRALAFFSIEFGALVVGMAKGALDEYESIITTRKTQRPPIVLRSLDPDYQRWFGAALGRTAAAEATLIQCAEQWMEVCRRSVEEGVPFSRKEDLRLNIIGREAMRLVWDAMESYIFRTAGSSAARNGQRMERTFRDLAMGWSHFHSSLADWSARELAREHLGLATEAPRPDQDYYAQRPR